MAGRAQWQSNEVVAWTERDGVGRPPRGPGRVLPVALAATLGAVFVGMLSTDTLCPEHRTWVLVLGSLGIAGTAVAITGLVQRWAVAPLLTLVVALDGIAIGLIDSIHDANRGHLIALAFGISALLAVALTILSVPLSVWDRRVRRQFAPAPAPDEAVAAPVAPAPAEPAPAPAAVRDEAVLTRHE
ncbi:MAG TPA: hypothetical protein VGJ43_18485 [Acidimicrobiales bacterium]